MCAVGLIIPLSLRTLVLISYGSYFIQYFDLRYKKRFKKRLSHKFKI